MIVERYVGLSRTDFRLIKSISSAKVTLRHVLFLQFSFLDKISDEATFLIMNLLWPERIIFCYAEK